ncbi:MAG: hypothetical protein ABI615_07490 [Chthoniobacterales bacterium]
MENKAEIKHVEVRNSILLGLLFLLFGMNAARAATPTTPENVVTLHAFIVSMPEAAANRFLVRYNLANQTPEAIAELRQLVTQKKATRINFPLINATNGQRETVRSGNMTVDTEIVISSAKQIADMNIVISCEGNKITTSIAAKNGVSKFLGTMTDISGKGSTGFVFATATFGEVPADHQSELVK